jgi:putative ABC transport system ATP-binding protein
MLNILGCLDKPSEDHILDGVNIKDLGRDELARNRKIGLYFRHIIFYPEQRLKRMWNFRCYIILKFLQRKEINELEALTAVKLESRIEHLPNQMSGGQQQGLLLQGHW